MGINVVNTGGGDLRMLTWTGEGEWLSTWLTGLDGDLST